MSRRRAARRAAIALVALVSCAAVAVWWTEFRFPARSERLSEPPVTLRIQDGVPSRELRAIRDGLQLGNRYLASLGAAPSRSIEARVARGDGCQPFMPAGRGAAGIAMGGFVCVDTLTPGWRWWFGRPQEPAAVTVAAHELVHAVQAERGCLPGPDEHRYLWLVEGTAVHLSWRAAVAGGRAGDADTVAFARRWLEPGLEPLPYYERRGGGGDPEYAFWHLAVRRLVADRGDGALIDFCDRVGDGRPWRAAFAASFGVTPAEFYASLPSPRDS